MGKRRHLGHGSLHRREEFGGGAAGVSQCPGDFRVGGGNFLDRFQKHRSVPAVLFAGPSHKEQAAVLFSFWLLGDAIEHATSFNHVRLRGHTLEVVFRNKGEIKAPGG